MAPGRVVTSVVNEKGQGVFEPDQYIETSPVPGGGMIRRFHTIPKVPVPDIRYSSQHELGDIANNEGATFLTCEMTPGAKSPMHATPSIDYGVMVSGEIVLILDSGEEKVLRPGDVYIQKSASHAWENRTSEVAIFTTTLIAARP